MSDEILECCIPYIQDPSDRSSISMVSKRWYELDRLTRRTITIYLCYTTTPQRLYDRFPNIESLRLKGKPRPAMYNLIPDDWGGFAKPWIDVLGSFRCLNSLHLRRMIVTDADLYTIGSVKGCSLQLLKLDKCSGFSTDGLLHITRHCSNLRTLFLEESSVDEMNGEWFHQLALSNTVLEYLNYYMTFLEKIKVEDLELLARNCPLISVKISDTDLFCLRNFFRIAARLQEFCGSCFDAELDRYADIVFPTQLSSFGPMYMLDNYLPICFPVANSLWKLDIVYATLTCGAQCDLLQRCHNLRVLETTDVIGDQGLEVVSLTCKRLKKLRVERGEDVPTLGVRAGAVTHRGLISVAQGCHDLEYLSINVADIGNEALECVGANLNNLNVFRLVLLDKEETITDLPLDNGVRALLQGCQNLRRLSLYLRQGGLSDIGLSYIGQYSQNVKRVLLGSVGETDAGLLEFSKGCPRLRALEMRACCFTERALAIAAKQLSSLRYIWVQGYRSSETGTIDLLEMARPYWNIELVHGDKYNINGNFVAYYSLAGQRTDHPGSIIPLALPNL
ncbi:coronatine-insensitive protein 1-like [Chenopodium quinoa]|uniref:coronatine-insensitive protein 1-like n=1 Tax=Chenopodium quinoa TaxID=63459 RepID=UPI000B788214|nr:coronatine-insensitive protein 1-like [Chenopodium quinoa]